MQKLVPQDKTLRDTYKGFAENTQYGLAPYFKPTSPLLCVKGNMSSQYKFMQREDKPREVTVDSIICA